MHKNVQIHRKYFLERNVESHEIWEPDDTKKAALLVILSMVTEATLPGYSIEEDKQEIANHSLVSNRKLKPQNM